ncbi:hypothetical protein QTJ16_005003 [Diplocarpon rosae]|uniref:CinA C-terminal domain-containing protein n=1 Tax=Diplocarpon rosae TaxID=946125 RepID=A0AAD9SY32_9HELO|nr:hypothetical protein QTJ16_005003 [Diplocarpon rosae]
MAKEFPPAKVREVVGEVAALLKERKETVSVAETAAGGIISASLLSTPGASGFYKGGLTVQSLLSQLTAYYLTDFLYASSTQRNLVYNSPAGRMNISSPIKDPRPTFGTAGPTGGNTPNRTPGYVALAVATESGTYKRELSTGLGDDREANMIAFAVEALGLLRDVIKGDVKL